MNEIISKVNDEQLNSVISAFDWQRILKGTSNTLFTAGTTIFKEGKDILSYFYILLYVF